MDWKAQKKARKEAAREQKRCARQGKIKVKPRQTINVDAIEEVETLSSTTSVEVVNESTLAAAQRLLREEPSGDVAVLNFASAKHPGGGFRTGAVAQEETLTRSSALFPCLVQMDEMYEHNCANDRGGLYSDYMIHSPRVPIFRDAHSFELLDEPYFVGVVTAPAVNAGCYRAKKRSKANAEQVIADTMMVRCRRILQACVAYKYTCLVLGAFGCGVFKNDPILIARIFHKLLKKEFAGRFGRVVFAILASSDVHPNIIAFEEILLSGASDEQGKSSECDDETSQERDVLPITRTLEGDREANPSRTRCTKAVANIA